VFRKEFSKMIRLIKILFALAVSLNVITNLYGGDKTVELFLPVNPDAISAYKLTDSTVRVMHGKKGKVLQINFGYTQLWPNIRFTAKKMNYSSDWSGAQALAVTLSNPMEKTVRLGLRVDSKKIQNVAGRRFLIFVLVKIFI
jgi:hypothetical protein